jgi:hypothetical protein
MAIAYVGGTTGTIGYNGTSYTITHIVEDSFSHVTLTLTSVVGINPSDHLILSGLSAATWLNNQDVVVQTIVGSTVTFGDPTFHGALGSTSETGTALDYTGATNNLTISYSSTSGNTLFMVFAVAAFTAYGTVVDSNGNTWVTAPFGSNVLAYMLNSPPITSVTISSPLGFPLTAVVGEYSGVSGVLFSYQTSGAGSPVTITESIAAGNWLISNCLSQTSALPSISASSGSLRNHVASLINASSGYVGVALVDNTSATPASVTDAVGVSPAPGTWTVVAAEIGTVTGTWLVTPGTQTILAGLSNGFTCTATTGFAGTITPSVTTSMPTGMSAAFVPATLPSSGGVTNLTISTTTSTPPGTYPLIVQATDGATTVSASIVIVVTDFEVVVSPSSREILPTLSTSFTVDVQSFNGYSGYASLSVSGLPSGVSGSFTPNNLPTPVLAGAYTSTLNLVATSGTSPGTYTLTITGTDGTSTRTTTCTLVIDGQSWALRWAGQV